MSETRGFTAQTARQFDHGPSLAHIAYLAEAAHQRGCTCQAYVDWFTYRRWQGLGYQVQKGEKGTKLSVFRPVEETDEQGRTVTKSIPWTSTVFCRCQVKEKEARR